MGTTIDTVAVVIGGRRFGRGSRKLADNAARACLERAGLGADDLDLLVNVGLYHDRNLGEPALAALIQDDIGANREDPHDSGHGTFSFDVANGACGILTALQIADGFLAAGTVRHALIVAGDSDPGRGLASHFPYAPAAAALLCRWHEGPAGLTDIRFANAPVTDGDGFGATVRFEHGRNQLRITEPPGFAAQAAVWAADVAHNLVADNGLVADDVDLVIANPQTPELLDELATKLDVPHDRVVSVAGHPRVHTAGLAFALDTANQQGELATGRTALLVSAGAGVTAGAALLRT